jgi:hypothetical protein
LGVHFPNVLHFTHGLYLNVFLHLNEVQGRIEARSKPYIGYGERVLEILTQQFVKSADGVFGYAKEQISTMQKIR